MVLAVSLPICTERYVLEEKMKRTLIFMLTLGCSTGEWVEPKAPQFEEDPAVVEEKSRRCLSARIRCELACFDRFGQTWGTLSPRYNWCMDECLERFERCSHRAHRIRATEGFADTTTYSWDQPTSDGVNGYYGYCGPTAASNLMANVCGVMKAPRDVSDMCFSWTPGTTPGNLVYALNAVGHCGRWAVCQPSPQDADVLGTVAEQLPVAALLDWDGSGTLHWITLVDINRTGGRCKVVFNHWGKQQRMGCNDFIGRWSLLESNVGWSSVASRVLKPFTYVCQAQGV